jgi:hypothetical protein
LVIRAHHGVRRREISLVDGIYMLDVLLVLKNMQARTKRTRAKMALMTVQQTSVDHLLLSSTGNSEGVDTSVLNMMMIQIKISKHS